MKLFRDLLADPTLRITVLRETNTNRKQVQGKDAVWGTVSGPQEIRKENYLMDCRGSINEDKMEVTMKKKKVNIIWLCKGKHSQPAAPRSLAWT